MTPLHTTNFHHAVSLTTKPEVSSKLKAMAKSYERFIRQGNPSQSEVDSLAAKIVIEYANEINNLTKTI